MNNYFGYARVSTAKQGEGVSIDAQKEAISLYAERNGFTICQWFEEVETAAKAGRPVFNDMIKALRKRQAVGLIVHKIDRSARNFRDWARIGELADEGFDIHFATETLDFRSRGGRLSADIQAVIAADYIRNLKEETRKGIDGRLKQGLYPFHAPLGYVNNGGGKVKTLDSARAPLIKELFRLYASGRYSIITLREEMISQGLTNRQGQPPSKRLVEKTLSNPFYCGVMRVGKDRRTFKGIHQPLITTRQFERIQDIKSGRFGKKHTRHDHLYRGLFKCADCRYSMIGERQKGRVYYRCHTQNCKTTSMREDRIEARVSELLADASLSKEATERTVAEVSSWVDDKIRENVAIQTHEAKLVELDKKLEALTDALLDRLVDKNTFAKRRESLLLDKTRVGEDAKKARDLVAAPEDVRKFLELIKSITGLYENMDHAEKRSFVETITSNRLVSGKDVKLEPSEWLQPVLDSRAVSYSALTRPETRRVQQPKDCWVEGLVTAASAESRAFLADLLKPKKNCPNISTGNSR
jgi:DNA invertase Pin-like site-specific DNA recombinase